MCGIVGAVAKRDVVPILLEGLRKLEYRGYDSAGLAVINNGMHRLRSVGRVAALSDLANQVSAHGHLGIAHTRWATHGAPTERNAHPHVSEDGLAVVHNGIIENHEAMRAWLVGLGYRFVSDTDTEVVAHLIHYNLKQGGDLFMATHRAVGALTGAYAIAVVSEKEPGRLVVARKGAPLLLGLGEGENFAASDASALLQVTRRIVYLEEGDVVELSTGGYRILDAAGAKADRPVHESKLSADAVELGPYRHYMQKEIFEQPGAVAATLEMVTGASSIVPQLFGVEAEAALQQTTAVTILACGTSYHAGMVARYWIEAIAGLPCNVEIASEYRYRDSVPNPGALVITISQSGETADTIAALQHAKALGQDKTLAICNVPESALVRNTRLRFLTRAGPEIGVASTKAFTTQLAALFLLTLVLAKSRGRLSTEAEQTHLKALRHLPAALQDVLELEPQLRVGPSASHPSNTRCSWAAVSTTRSRWKARSSSRRSPTSTPKPTPPGSSSTARSRWSTVTCPWWQSPPTMRCWKSSSPTCRRSRRGEANCTSSPTPTATSRSRKACRSSGSRRIAARLSPILHVVPLQLLAYHVALVRGTDVDKPRNLAKSVTVE